MNMQRWHKIALGGVSSLVILASLVHYFEPSKTPTIPYKDVTGVWTNCDGNTHGVVANVTVTPDMCAVINEKNQKEALEFLGRVTKVPLTNNQRAAFADLIYNVGEDKFYHSTILRLINEGKTVEACRGLLQWVYAGGKKMPGLIARRQAEYTICLTPN